MLVFLFNPQNEIPAVFQEFYIMVFFWGFLRDRRSVIWVGGRDWRGERGCNYVKWFFKWRGWGRCICLFGCWSVVWREWGKRVWATCQWGSLLGFVWREGGWSEGRTREESTRGNRSSSIRLFGSRFWGVTFVWGGTHLPYRNSQVRKSRIELVSPLICSISKSKTLKIAYHLAKLCLETRFWTSFCRTSLVLLQSTWIKNFWLNRSSWNFETHNMIDKISFVIVL